MKIIKTCLVAAGVAALAACNGGAEENNMAADANMMTDNFAVDENFTDMNATDMNDLNAVDMNDMNATDTTTNSY